MQFLPETGLACNDRSTISGRYRENINKRKVKPQDPSLRSKSILFIILLFPRNSKIKVIRNLKSLHSIYFPIKCTMYILKIFTNIFFQV